MTNRRASTMAAACAATALVIGTVGLVGTAGADSVGAASPRAAGAISPRSVDGGDVLTVPADHDTIQEAVDAAEPGDLVLIEPGTYHEAVDVTVDNLTIRGVDRNEVILDGEFALDNGMRVFSDGVAVENMTAMNYAFNGFFWIGVTGYRGSYLTAYRNGDYGIYAFDSTHGTLEHSYAAGSPDAGFYIGQCYPCDALIIDVEAEHNGLGYSGTNAGGNLYIVESSWHHNRAGIVPNSGSYELCYPERETTIVGNSVYANNQGDTPAIEVAILAMGNGILVAGGYRNEVMRNRVWDHDGVGIGLVPFPEEGANDDIPGPDELDRPCDEARLDPVNENPPEGLLLWDSYDNAVTDNVLDDNRAADIAVGSLGPVGDLGNCFSGNEHSTSAPLDLEALAPCDGDAADGDWEDGALDLVELMLAEHPEPVDYEVADLPELREFDNMSDAENAPPAPATDMPRQIDLDAIGVPDASQASEGS